MTPGQTDKAGLLEGNRGAKWWGACRQIKKGAAWGSNNEIILSDLDVK